MRDSGWKGNRLALLLRRQIKNGKVIRDDEYFDTAQLTKRAGRPGEGMILKSPARWGIRLLTHSCNH